MNAKQRARSRVYFRKQRVYRKCIFTIKGAGKLVETFWKAHKALQGLKAAFAAMPRPDFPAAGIATVPEGGKQIVIYGGGGGSGKMLKRLAERMDNAFLASLAGPKPQAFVVMVGNKIIELDTAKMRFEPKDELKDNPAAGPSPFSFDLPEGWAEERKKLILGDWKQEGPFADPCLSDLNDKNATPGE